MQMLQRPWVEIQHPPTQWNLRGSNEAVLNAVHEIYKYHKQIPLLLVYTQYTIRWYNLSVINHSAL